VIGEERAMAIDIAAVTAAIAAASAGVDLIDRIYYQVRRVINGTPEPTGPDPQHGQKIERQGDELVATGYGPVQRITGADLAKLPPNQLRLIRAYEQSMENHVAVWEAVYPQLALETNKVTKAQDELRLKGIVRDMGRDLTGIIDFLESSGLQLEDHYLEIRALVAREAGL
jgi:hypothetical protein